MPPSLITSVSIVVGHALIGVGLAVVAVHERAMRRVLVACAAFVTMSGLVLAWHWPADAALAGAWVAGVGVGLGVWLIVRARRETSVRSRPTPRSSEATDEQMRRFVSVASHDLREPLRRVSSYAQMLARRYKGRLDADADEMIRHIVEGCGAMRRLVQGLSELSRVNRPHEHVEVVVLSDAFDQACHELQREISESGAIIRCAELPQLRGSKSEIVRLFVHLLDNAVRYNEHSPPHVDVGVEQVDGEPRLFVRDDGIGIDPQHQERIFDPFKRLHSRATHPGSGLGLTICRRIVERHGGRIWCESTPGRGSTFWCAFPDAETTQLRSTG